MKKGVIDFISPDECEIGLIKFIRDMKPDLPSSLGLEEETLLEGYKEGNC